jgi:hypothetical protein
MHCFLHSKKQNASLGPHRFLQNSSVFKKHPRTRGSLVGVSAETTVTPSSANKAKVLNPRIFPPLRSLPLSLKSAYLIDARVPPQVRGPYKKRAVEEPVNSN